MIPNSASMTTNLFSLLLKFETLKIRKNSVHFIIIIDLNVEAGLISNNGNLRIRRSKKDYDTISNTRIVEIIEETVNSTIYNQNQDGSLQ